MGIRRLTKKEELPFIIMEQDDMFRSYGICNLKQTRPKVNLDNVHIESNMKKRYEDNYPSKYKIKVFYKDLKLKEVKELGRGAYGKVVLYSNSDINVVVKIPFDAPREEPDILKNYMKSAFVCHHYVVPIRAVNDQHGNPFIVMQQANDEITELEMDERLKIKLIIYMAKVLKCFFKHGYAYTDLKKDNVLYRCNGEKIEFFLGDIGGFAKVEATSKNDNLSYTFVPPEYAYGDDKIRKVNEASSIYVFGAFMADVYGLANDIFYSDENNNYYTSEQLKKVQIPKFHSKIKNSNIPEKVKEIIIKCTSITPKKRLECNYDAILEKLIK